MTQEKGMVVREVDIQASPAEVVTLATEQSRLLMDIVEKTKCYQNISGKKYLQVEAWETIGAFNQTHAETESITPIIKEDKTIGYQARVQLWKNGIVVGGAIMPCYFTENCCKGKDGDAKHKACMSAAQTFATSKAYRMNFSYVAILAGFQPLPAEEVTEDMKQPVDMSVHYCKEHETKFFKTGRMRSFAHPIEGTDPTQWCHEHTEKDAKELYPPDPPHAAEAARAAEESAIERQAKTDAPQSKSEPLKEESSGNLPESLIDMEWLKESLKKVKWTEKTAATWLTSKYKVQGGLLNDVLGRLTKEQLTEFTKEVQDRLEMA